MQELRPSNPPYPWNVPRRQMTFPKPKIVSVDVLPLFVTSLYQLSSFPFRPRLRLVHHQPPNPLGQRI